jgi:lipopolysaccharide transport system permease protein
MNRTVTIGYRASAAPPHPVRQLGSALAEVWDRRRLIRYLVQADLKKKGADTLLGNVWWVLDPFLQMIVYVILVSVIAARTQPDYPLFIFAAILPWKWFTSSIGDAITSVSSQERLIKQIQFPKLVLPTAATVAGVVNFAFGLIPLVGLLLLFYRDRLSPWLLWLPLIAVVQFVFTLGLGYLVAALNVFYRDVGNVSRHALRIWFYLSPGLYGPEQLRTLAESHPTVAHLMTLNPFYALFQAYRAVIYGSTDGGPAAPDWSGLAAVFLFSLAFLAAATLVFKRLEPAFAKVL